MPKQVVNEKKKVEKLLIWLVGIINIALNLEYHCVIVKLEAYVNFN